MSSVCGWSEPSLGELPMESWMSHLPCALWDIPLSHLAIPGRLLWATSRVLWVDGSQTALIDPVILIWMLHTGLGYNGERLWGAPSGMSFSVHVAKTFVQHSLIQIKY